MLFRSVSSGPCVCPIRRCRRALPQVLPSSSDQQLLETRAMLRGRFRTPESPGLLFSASRASPFSRRFSHSSSGGIHPPQRKTAVAAAAFFVRHAACVPEPTPVLIVLVFSRNSRSPSISRRAAPRPSTRRGVLLPRRQSQPSTHVFPSGCSVLSSCIFRRTAAASRARFPALLQRISTREEDRAREVEGGRVWGTGENKKNQQIGRAHV